MTDAGGASDAGFDPDGGASGQDGGPPPVALVLNEIAAEGEPKDWFEVYNPSDQPLDLTGYTYTDDFADPGKALFPAGAVVPAQGYYVQYLDDVDPGFKLGVDEELSLFDPALRRLDRVDWKLDDSPVGGSFGRLPNLSGPFVTLAHPTPGGPNQGDGQVCGDGRLDAPELCDGAELAGQSCLSRGYSSGVLTCNASCDAFDESACLGSAGGVAINELSSSGDDLIELIGVGPGPASLLGWYLVDGGYDPLNPNDGHRYDFGATTLGLGERLVLTKGTEHPFGLGDADRLDLYGPDDQPRDQVEWTAGQANTSYCRVPEGTGPFGCCLATFNAANTAPIACGGDGPELVLNEASSDGDDLIELYNRGGADADLSDWGVADEGYDPLDPATLDHLYRFPTGTVLGPNAYLVLSKGTDHGFGLGGADGVLLYNSAQQLVDEVHWADGLAVPSYARQPNGSGPFATSLTTSFGAPNP